MAMYKVGKILIGEIEGKMGISKLNDYTSDTSQNVCLHGGGGI